MQCDDLFLWSSSYLPAIDLLRLSEVCWRCFVIANNEELWRELVLLHFVNESKVAEFCFMGSWKRTYFFPSRLESPFCVTKHPFAHHSNLICPSSINFLLHDGFVLQPPSAAIGKIPSQFARYNVCGMDLSTLPMNLQGIDRRHKLTRQQFMEEYEIPNKPVILTGLMEEWPAMRNWKLANLVKRHPDLLLKTNSRSTNGRRFRMRLFDFVAYCERWNGEKPLYVFDKKIMNSDVKIVEEYSVPDYFKEDLFELMEEDDRPDYRWLLLGPNGSGSPFHVDPHDSSAWNAVIEGTKRVSFYPPGVIPPGVDEELIYSDYYASEDTMKWYREIFPTLRPSELPLECLVRPGEILFIPSGWWHQVHNIGHTTAFTQNYCSLITFPRVAKHMNEHAKKGVRKDFKIALAESEDFRHLADFISVNRPPRKRH